MDEISFISIVKPHILACRPGDWSHALRVVKWVKELGKNRKDLDLLIRAGYIHDIGWRNVVLSDEKLTKEKLKELESVANMNSEQFIREVLAEEAVLGKADMETILRLVKAADSHESAAEDEAIIVDADNLSKLDINHLKEKYVQEDWKKMYQLWEETFPKRIQTKFGKEIYPRLLESLQKDINTALLLRN